MDLRELINALMALYNSKKIDYDTVITIHTHSGAKRNSFYAIEELHTDDTDGHVIIELGEEEE